MSDQPSPDFGPGGYLPDRASKRARKIVLRSPMGMQWIVAAGLFGVILLAVGLLWLSTSGPPDDPYVATVRVEAGQGPTVTHLGPVDAWVVTGAGPVLAVPGRGIEDLAWCEASRRLESSDGRVWSATGRGLGTDSLSTHPVVVHDGTVYVDPTTVVDGPRPRDDAATPAC